MSPLLWKRHRSPRPFCSFSALAPTSFKQSRSKALRLCSRGLVFRRTGAGLCFYRPARSSEPRTVVLVLVVILVLDIPSVVSHPCSTRCFAARILAQITRVHRCRGRRRG